MRLGLLDGLIPNIPLVHKRHGDRVACDRWYFVDQHTDLAPVLLDGRGDVESQQMPQGIHGSMDLGATTAVGPVRLRRRAVLSILAYLLLGWLHRRDKAYTQEWILFKLKERMSAGVAQEAGPRTELR
jgi:hypothetical protein